MKETVGMLRRYVVQETVGPLKHIGRSAAYGTAGALLTGVGAVLLMLAVLRVLQTETASVFAGNWSFAPYLLTAVVALGAIGVAAALGLRGGRSRRQGGA